MDDLDYLLEQTELQTRRDERLENCGKLVVVAEQPDGSRITRTWRCKDPRCPTCNKIKGDELRSRIENSIMLGAVIYFCTLPVDLAKKLCKNLGRENYLKSPASDTEDYIFFSWSSETIEDIVDAQFINDFDWVEFARKKCERNISGNLGKINEDKPQDESGYEIEVMDVVAGPENVVEQAYSKTVTSNFIWQQPENIDECQAVRRYVNGEFLKNITALGGKIQLIMYRTVRIQTFSISILGYSKIKDPN